MLLIDYLVPVAIIADHKLAPRFQSVQKLSEKLLLVGNM